MTAGTAFRNPPARNLVPPGGGPNLSQEFATLHVLIIEHFCSIHNALLMCARSCGLVRLSETVLGQVAGLMVTFISGTQLTSWCAYPSKSLQHFLSELFFPLDPHGDLEPVDG